MTCLADCFSTLIRNVSLMFNPETMVIVGDYAIAHEHFDQHMKEKFHQFRFLASTTPMEVLYDTRVLPELDAKGGAIALIDHFFADSSIYEDPVTPKEE